LSALTAVRAVSQENSRHNRRFNTVNEHIQHFPRGLPTKYRYYQYITNRIMRSFN
jgi:hypothetical protein